MRKKILSAIVSSLLITSLCTSCVQKGDETGDDVNKGTKTEEKIKVGMVTDAGTIDDKSFNQGSWEGIRRYEDEKGTIESQYLKPNNVQETDYINAIDTLAETGSKIIVAPGFKLETAVNRSAEVHKDVSFILIDGQPHGGDQKFVNHDNVVSVFFNEHEAGFLVGLAAALSSKTGKLGFIGGMKIPPVEKFYYGYQAGVLYANKNLATKASITDAQYQGSFDNIPAGQTLAAGMYGKGIDIIFHAAGGVGNGVFNEAKARSEKGEKVWVIGVDSDQYDQGILKDGKIVVPQTQKEVDDFLK